MSNMGSRQVSTGTVVVVIVIVIIVIAAAYYFLMKPRSGGEAPFGGKGLPMTKMKQVPQGAVQPGQGTPMTMPGGGG